MRFAGNFHPEWGYLAPAPNFMRTARVVVVATAIGATAGAAVVLSLAERSAPGAMADAGKTLVVVHSLVQPAEAAAPATAPLAATTPVIAPVAAAVPAAPVAPAAAAKVQASIQPSAPPVTASAQPIAPPPTPSESRTVSTSAAPASVAALSESPPVTEASPPPASNAVAPAPLAPQKDAIKKPAATGQQPLRGPQPAFAAAAKKKPEERGLGPALRRLFSAN